MTLDPILMKAADILPWERVEIYDVTNGERIATYAIPGAPGRGRSASTAPRRTRSAAETW